MCGKLGTHSSTQECSFTVLVIIGINNSIRISFFFIEFINRIEDDKFPHRHKTLHVQMVIKVGKDHTENGRQTDRG